MKKKLFILLILCLMFSLYAQTFEGKGAKSPEEAAGNYIKALKSCDYNQIINCYAVETFVENYNLDKSMEKFNSIHPTMKMIYPNDNLLKQTGNYEVLDWIIRNVKYQIWNLNEIDFFKNAKYVILNDNTQEVIRQTIPSEAEERLKRIQFSNQFISIDEILVNYVTGGFPIDISIYQEEVDDYKKAVKEYYKKTKAIYGCKNIKDVIASFSIEGREYYFFAETVQYGNKWYISPNQGFVAGILAISNQNGCIIAADEL
ncbi:MAG: hypothetical protein J6S91_01460 [Treponema sp.]|nr:hypothetical protein [Treponema sp.]